jgi:hypothetical protein
MVIQIAARRCRGCPGSRGNGSGVVGNQASSRRGFGVGDGLKSGFDGKCGLWKWERREWVRIANIFLEEEQSEIIDKNDILCCRAVDIAKENIPELVCAVDSVAVLLGADWIRVSLEEPFADT